MFIKNRFFCTIYSDHGVPFPCSSWILPPYGPTNPNLHFPSHHKQATKKKGKKMCRQIMGYESIMFSHLNCLQQKPSLRVDSFTPSAQHSPSFPSVAKTPKPDEHTLPFFLLYMHTHKYTGTSIHVYWRTQAYSDTCIHTLPYSYTECTEVHICVHSSNNAYIQVLHMGTHTRMHTHEHTHIQSCIFAHVHTCAYSGQFTSLYTLTCDALISWNCSWYV